MALGIPIIDSLLGLGSKIVDRIVPDRNKERDQANERTNKQADITSEGERAKNYFTPRAIIMYGMAFSVLYGVVIQPFLFAFGVSAPKIDYSAPLRILLGLLGLDLTGG